MGKDAHTTTQYALFPNKDMNNSNVWQIIVHTLKMTNWKVDFRTLDFCGLTNTAGNLAAYEVTYVLEKYVLSVLFLSIYQGEWSMTKRNYLNYDSNPS